MKNNNSIDYIKRAQKYTCKIFWETPKHNHSFWEFVFGVKGVSEQVINDCRYELKRGDLIIIKPGDVQSYKIKDVKQYEHIDFYVSNEDIFNACNFMNEDLYNHLMNEKTALLKLSENTFYYFLEQLKLLNVTQSNKNDLRPELLYKNILTSITYEIFNHIESLKTPLPEWYTTILTALNDPDIICGTLDDLIKLTYMSHGYLCKLFKEQTGERLIDYFTKAKLDYSKKLMLNENYNILDISSRIGYNSLSHYIRIFKNYNKMTPLDYRKKVLKK